MAKSRRTPKTLSPPPAGRVNAPNAEHSRRSWWPAAAIVVVVVVGAVAWRTLPSLVGSGVNEGDAIQPVSTLTSPDMHSLLIDPTNPDRVLFGSHAGIQESRDGGFTWQAGSLKNTDAMSLAANPKDATTFYAAGHDVFQISRDGGKTWAPVKNNLPGTDIHAFAQDATDPNRLFANVMDAGLVTSTDGGTTWVPLPAQPPNVGNQIALAINTTGLYATTTAGLALSRDQGSTWEAVPGNPGGVISLAAPPNDPQRLYAGTPNGVVMTSDGGKTWASIGPQGVIVVVALAVAPTDPNRLLFITLTGALYRSDDAGATWRSPR